MRIRPALFGVIVVLLFLTFGGPGDSSHDAAVLAERLAATGLDPKRVGERVVDAIRTKTFYAFVSAVPADTIRARHRRIEAALVWTDGPRLMPVPENMIARTLDQLAASH